MSDPTQGRVTPSAPIQAAPGVRDILPDERGRWRRAEGAAHRLSRAYGYREIVTPVIEYLDLVVRVGESTDIVQKELFVFEDRGGRRLVLRPEGTAGMVRAYFQGGLNQGPQPVRLYLLGPMFRGERPQAGRYRQFNQFDVEVIGDASAAIDAETIELSLRWLEACGLRGLTLQLNSIGDQSCRPAYLERLVEYYAPLAERLCPACQRRLHQNPLRLLDCKERQCQPLKAGAPDIVDHLCDECADHFDAVRRLLAEAGIDYQLNPQLVRGLDYYTRTVFELQDPAHGGAQNALGGGGRYDGLAAALGYTPTPAVGFACGLERVVALMPADGEERASGLFLVGDGPGLEPALAQLGRLARTAIDTTVDYTSRSLRAKMRAADRLRARYVAILSPAGVTARTVTLRDMVTGDQEEVAWDQVPEKLG